MKKLTIIAAMLIGSIGVSMSGVGEPVKTITVDSSKSEIKFDVNASKAQILNVSVQGVEEDFTSIALIDQRGKSIFYSFVKSDNETFEINLKNLTPGKYYVKLNMDSEIRMKTLIVQG
ncbi:T9SS type A sorting domain-containing protein [Brumimicrobium aurantiacum]|uniref:T9SS C-terminal target domain-containing protein n=1 Tax=Brumimicrobium aurantiacum TaxID=1737063 RepID=A0A3E1EV29_9FLAO|nr:T9SS type A sorting domain-containing protein [Brumimicrobium aurantiacum]RFC53419.1 T9SS C-terminal target domain-containing protein [Brumimicrobium aurantiacum]